MSEAIFSNQWYRVEYLTPQLHGHVGVHRHAYRGLIWYILEDKSSGRHHRFNEAAYRFIGLLDGYRTVNQAWELICERFGDDAPTQNDVIQLLAQLHSGNLLKSGVAINTEELLERHERHQNTKFFQTLTNPFSQKIPLWDPDAFLQRHLLKVRWLFQRSVLALWLLLVTGAGLLAAIHWQELTGNVLINTLSPYNLTLLFVLYPLIKLLHEMGHAFATKIAGGDVHEMGIMFLLLVPIPYVNVSAASHFRNKYTRMLVGSAGIMVELFLASLSLCLWLMIEPGIVRDIIFNIMLIGGFSTLFFNGNPLLKYDGYYVFADALELPNLAQRANSYCIYLCQYYLFGFKHAQSPAYTWGESVWFFIYSISSFVYRLGILWFIVVYVTEKFFVIGIILACWLITAQIIFPLFKIGHFIYSNLAIRDHQYRIAGVSVVVLGLFINLVFIVPFPSYTNAQGVIWLPEHAQLRAESEGFIGPILAANNSPIQSGTEVVELEDPFLQTKVKILQARINELSANYRAEKLKELVKARIDREEIPVVESELAHAQKKLQSMQVKGARAGRLLIPDADDLPGRFLKQGDLIGYVIDQSLPIVRTVITQADIGKLRGGTVAVELRLANRIERIIPAKIIRETPEATTQLHSEALASTGGGKMILDPAQPDKLMTVEKFFLVDVEFAPVDPNLFIGTRAYVRFDHGGETLAKQWHRSILQLFLRQFNV